MLNDHFKSFTLVKEIMNGIKPYNPTLAKIQDRSRAFFYELVTLAFSLCAKITNSIYFAGMQNSTDTW